MFTLQAEIMKELAHKIYVPALLYSLFPVIK